MSSIFRARKQDLRQDVPEISDTSILAAKKLEEVIFNKAPHKESPLESEDLERDIERSSARTLSRIGETFLGLPGDVQSFVKFLLPENLQSLAGPSLPTSQQLQGISEKATLGYTKPKTEFEEKADEFSKDVAGMMLPGASGYSFARNLGIPLAGLVAKEAMNDSDLAKTGVMFALDLASGKRAQIPGRKGLTGNVQRYVSSLFEKAQNALPQGQNFVDVGPMVSNLQAVQQDLLRGGSRPSTAAALTKIEEILSKAQSGYMDVHEFPAFRKSINEIRQSLGGFGFEMPRASKGQAIANLERVKSQIIDAGERYGKQMNPEFLQSWQEANQAQAVLSRSNVISNAMQKHAGKLALHPITKTLFGLGGGGLSIFKPQVIGPVAAGAGVWEAGKLVYRVAQSPALRRFYTNAIRSALAGQTSQMTANIGKLDKKIREEEKEKEKRKKEIFR